MTGTTSNWIFTIRDIVTDDVRDCHASRLKSFADRELRVDTELPEHVAHRNEGHVVERLEECRFSTETKAFELRVEWRGLDSIEDSWEPASNIQENVPVLYRAFVRAHSEEAVVKRMTRALG